MCVCVCVCLLKLKSGRLRRKAGKESAREAKSEKMSIHPAAL